ncbi:rhodanese-like domain-containing protein [Thermophagus xiamenensis]|uniref:rhodanese-like domain-containing protein n=1 Tax=Thermophagus xiamenensis TaxID=385682 RepID=UPI001300C294|nr:rhodanese-like domain-containing protein [Thermophagus xiamenensis]
MLLLFLIFPCLTLYAQGNLTAKQFSLFMDTCKNVVVIDVRNKEEFLEERIPGAISCENKDALFQVTDTIDKQQPILVYCNMGNRSKSALELLKNKGFKNIYQLKKGFVEWRRKGYPIVQN